MHTNVLAARPVISELTDTAGQSFLGAHHSFYSYGMQHADSIFGFYYSLVIFFQLP